MERVAVIDYGMGNLRSVEKALVHVAGKAYEIAVTSDPQVVASADRIVFPGQGAIRDCMQQLRAHRLEESVVKAAREKPFLGICIGLQALLEGSDEDPATIGLGLYRGGCHRFPSDARDATTGERLKIPHMGWNQVRFAKPHPLWDHIEDGARFYFVHSYYAAPEEPNLIAGTTHYAKIFTSAIAEGFVFGVQFHPEKSQQAGLQLLRNFLGWRP